MPFFGLMDLRALCRDTGVPVSFNGVATYPDTGEPVLGLFEAPGQDAVFNMLAVDDTAFTLQLPYNAFVPMPGQGDTLYISGGVSPGGYAVRTATAIDDGSMTLLTLKKL